MGKTAIGWSVTTLIWSALVASCADDDLYVMFTHTELRDAERVFAGAGCSLAIERRGLGGGSSVSTSSGSADPSNDFSVDQQSGDTAYQVIVRSRGQEIARRRYPESFLRSGDLDRFEVTTQGGRQFELAYRGAKDCENPSFDE